VHAVVGGLDRLRGVLALRLSTPAVTVKAMKDEWARFGAIHGAFTRYANEAIWRRWYTPITSRLPGRQ
jgi:hypothetical protein